jgi:hypothetical protein
VKIRGEVARMLSSSCSALTPDGPGAALTNIPPGLSSSAHRNLCTVGKRKEASHFGVGRGGNGHPGGR